MSRAATLLVLLLAAGPAGAGVLYVDDDAPPGGAGGVSNPFASLHLAMDAASPGDTLSVAAGVYSALRTTSTGLSQVDALLILRDGVTVLGAGPGVTRLVAPVPGERAVYGITAGPGVGRGARVEQLSVEGPCRQGINLRDASPTLVGLAVTTDVVGGSSVAMDVRDGSAPLCEDLLLDGGHSALFIEFGSSGEYNRCRTGARPNEGLALSAATPAFVDCDFAGTGRDTIVLNQFSRPSFDGCRIGAGARWTVRVTSYPSGTTVDMTGQDWGTQDATAIAAAILDAVDDPTLGATVEFLPLATAVATAPRSFGGLKAAP